MQATLREMQAQIASFEADVDKKFIQAAIELLVSLQEVKKSGKCVNATTRSTLERTKAQVSKNLDNHIKCRKTPNAEVVRLSKTIIFVINSITRVDEHKSVSKNIATEECEMRLERPVVKRHVIEPSYDEELEALMENAELAVPVVKKQVVEPSVDDELEALMENAKLFVPTVAPCKPEVIVPKTQKASFDSWMVYCAIIAVFMAWFYHRFT